MSWRGWRLGGRGGRQSEAERGVLGLGSGLGALDFVYISEIIHSWVMEWVNCR